MKTIRVSTLHLRTGDVVVMTTGRYSVTVNGWSGWRLQGLDGQEDITGDAPSVVEIRGLESMAW